MSDKRERDEEEQDAEILWEYLLVLRSEQW